MGSNHQPVNRFHGFLGVTSMAFSTTNFLEVPTIIQGLWKGMSQQNMTFYGVVPEIPRGQFAKKVDTEIGVEHDLQVGMTNSPDGWVIFKHGIVSNSFGKFLPWTLLTLLSF